MGIGDYLQDAGSEIASSYRKRGPLVAAGTTMRAALGAVPAIGSAMYDEGRIQAADALTPAFQIAEGATGVNPGGLLPSPRAAAPAPAQGAPAAPAAQDTGVDASVAPAGPQAAAAPAARPLQVSDAGGIRTITDNATPEEASQRYADASQQFARQRFLDAKARAQDPRYQQANAPAIGAGVPDVNAQITALQNNGTLSGMINARTLARRTDADRANAVAVTNAAANTTSAGASATNAATTAAKAGPEIQHMSAVAQGVNFENQGKATVANLRARLAAATDPEERRRISDELLVNQGKDPKENAFKIAQYEDAIDPQNPLAGTRKVPVMVSATGQTTFLKPPAGNGAPSLDQWLNAAKADPRNRGVADKDLVAHYNKNYGGK